MRTIIMSTKVSVCIPVYGVEKYIERCARSLFEQTMHDGIEFIFVNDCTPDKSIEILEDVLTEYPHRKEQTKIFHHERNKGLVAARKTGLIHASGEYIIHCDSDDWVDKNFYETMYVTAVRNNADVVYAPYITHFNNSSEKSSLPFCTQADNLLQNVLDNRFQWSLINKLFRSSIAKSSHINCSDYICYSEDLLRTCQTLSLCKRSYPADNVFYHYFKGNPQAYTKNFSRKSLDNLSESIRILKTSLHDRYNFDTLQTFMLFMGIIYRLYSAKEFHLLARNISAKQIILNKNSFPIRVVVYGATVSYSVVSCFCNILLKIRKLIKTIYWKKES